MLTIARMRLPVCPVHAPLRTRFANAAIRSSTACTSAHDVASVDHDRGRARRTQRDVQDGPVLGDVDAITAKHLPRCARGTATPRRARTIERASRPSRDASSSRRTSPAASATNRVPRAASAANSDRRCTARISSACALSARHSGSAVSVSGRTRRTWRARWSCRNRIRREWLAFDRDSAPTYTSRDEQPIPAVAGTAVSARRAIVNLDRSETDHEPVLDDADATSARVSACWCFDSRSGAVFIVHGGQKLFVMGPSGTGGMLTQMGIPGASVIGPVLSFVEPLAGVGVLLGLAHASRRYSRSRPTCSARS